MMPTDILVYAPNLLQADEQVTALGGRLTHVLTSHLIVITLPDGVDVRSLSTVSKELPAAMESLEHMLAEGWIHRFGAESPASARLERLAAQPAISWDTPGFTPPDPPLDTEGPESAAPPPPEERSTGTPTSLYLTGSVAVGVVMVSGPPWTNIPGSLKHVSVGADGAVWGVNANDNIYRRDGGGWTPIPGSLKQISVGNASNVWGVNANDNIYRWDGGGWTPIPGSLKHVSVASSGAVWGVNANDNIYRRDGGGWTPIPGSLKQISVGNATNVWGVNANDNIFRRSVLATP